MQIKQKNLPTFGTDGVRGLADKIFSPSSVSSLALVFAQVLDANHTTPIVLARDTRISGDSIASAFKASVTAFGIDVIDLGVVSTPAAIYVMRSIGAIGAVISASHNPYYDNGIKLFDRGGIKLSTDQEKEIEDLWHKHILDTNITSWFDKNDDQEYLFGKVSNGTLAVQDYLNNLISLFNKTSFKGYRIILDCANGSVSSYANIPFEKLGAEVILINNQPSGTNINKDCGATNVQSLVESVLKNNATIGFAFDGDADRVIAVDSKGNIRDGDDLIYFLSNLTNQKNAVMTVMSNGGYIQALKEKGISTTLTDVGDKNVLSECIKTNTRFGAEQSGHIIDMDYIPSGDGLYIALLITSLLAENKTSIEEVCNNIELYSQKLVNIKVEKTMHNKIVKDSILLNLIEDFSKRARILVRPSGTEPLIRVLVESPSQELVEDMSAKLKEVIENI